MRRMQGSAGFTLNAAAPQISIRRLKSMFKQPPVPELLHVERHCWRSLNT